MRRCCKQIKEDFDCHTDHYAIDEAYWDYLMKIAEDYVEDEE